MRSGLVGQKVGMSRILAETGEHLPVTLIKVLDCKVVEHKTDDKHGYTALTVAYGSAKAKNVTKPMRGVHAKLGVEAPKGLTEFRVETVDLINVGEELRASHFEVGQHVDVVGTTIGKGFAGAMKRHNFGGLRASHGVSVSHRSHGSTGNRQDPGKVFKNKKMAGHMGQVRVTQQNLEVVYINEEQNTIAVRGSVPGSAGGLLFLKDAVKKTGK